MDIRQNEDKRVENQYLFDILEETPKYDYVKEGVLTKTLPKILFRGNSILVTFLQLIDLRIILMLKSIEKVKHFKWISWY